MICRRKTKMSVTQNDPEGYPTGSQRKRSTAQVMIRARDNDDLIAIARRSVVTLPDGSTTRERNGMVSRKSSAVIDETQTVNGKEISIAELRQLISQFGDAWATEDGV
jgi:hypothetical protein